MSTAAIGDAGEAGFTLVEVLVALTLMSFLGVALFGSLRFSVLAWEKGTAHADRVDRVLVTQTFLRQVLAAAYPYYLRDDPTRPHVDFEGTAQSLSFLTTAPQTLADGGRVRLALSTASGSGGTNLMMTARGELADAPAGPDRILVPRIARVELAYFGATRASKVAAWHDSWINESWLPQLIRVRLSYPRDDGRVWPDLLVAPRIGADVSCIHDALTKRCRGR